MRINIAYKVNVCEWAHVGVCVGFPYPFADSHAFDAARKLFGQCNSLIRLASEFYVAAEIPERPWEPGAYFNVVKLQKARARVALYRERDVYVIDVF